MRKVTVIALFALVIVLASCTPIVLDETENASVGAVFINEIIAANTHSGADTYYNNYSDWIELYNASDRVIDLSFHYLTDNFNRPQKWEIPQGTVIGPGEYLAFYADGDDIYDHTNFKLSQEGEEVALFNSVGMKVDAVEFGPLAADVSYGRQPDGGKDFYYFSRPTLTAPNTFTGAREFTFAPVTRPSIPGGSYNGPQAIELTTDTPSDRIRFTLDGSIPNEDSTLYTAPLQLESTAVLRVRAFKDGALPGPVLTHSYFIDENISLPVVSISTDPANLWDDDIGIYTKGPNAYPDPPYYEANFWEDWERVINLEYFPPGGTAALNITIGVQIFGGDSKAYDQKSLALFPRDKYGGPVFDYKFFDNKDVTAFKRLVLRTSGQDWAETLFRDAMHHTLVEGRMDIDLQAYTPALLFLNGECWGIQNIREKIDEEYIETNYGFPQDQIDYLYHDNGDVQVKRGDRVHYDAMLAFIETNDMTLPENYEYIKTRMDVGEFLNYNITQLYFVNTDWPGVNVKFWRPRTPEGKWRWILFDTDFGSGLYNTYRHDMMIHITNSIGDAWPNPAWSTFLFRKLLENPEFRDEFIQRFAAHMDTTFSRERVLQMIETMKSRIQPEVHRSHAKWGGSFAAAMKFYFPSTLAEWEAKIDVVREFAINRPIRARQHLSDYFGLDGTFQLTVNVHAPEGGKVTVNGVELPAGHFKGQFFRGVPLRLAAKANPGYRFVQWSGPAGLSGQQDYSSLTLTGDAVITVVFTK